MAPKNIIAQGMIGMIGMNRALRNKPKRKSPGECKTVSELLTHYKGKALRHPCWGPGVFVVPMDQTDNLVLCQNEEGRRCTISPSESLVPYKVSVHGVRTYVLYHFELEVDPFRPERTWPERFTLRTHDLKKNAVEDRKEWIALGFGVSAIFETMVEPMSGKKLSSIPKRKNRTPSQPILLKNPTGRKSKKAKK